MSIDNFHVMCYVLCVTCYMRILHTVKQYHPSSGGMYEVVRQLSKNLARFGHDITIATTKLPAGYKPDCGKIKIKEFAISGNFVVGLKGEVKKYQDFLINSDFDIIINFAAQQPMTDAMLPILDKIKAKKVFVPTGFSAFYMPEYKKYFENMKTWMKKYDMNVFLSNDYRDTNFARKNGIKNITIIPNGASKEEFLMPPNIDIRKKLSITRDAFFILHVGSHTKQKGHKEAIKIFSQAKINNAVFLIVGNPGACLKNCKKQEEKLNKSTNYKKYNKRLIIKHLTRKETIAAYVEANLFLFPSNTECSPIVLFECMASKTPFLTTDVGNAKEIIEWSGAGKLLPTIKKDSLDPLLISIFKKYIKITLNSVNHKREFSIAKIKKSALILEQLYNNKEELNTMAKNGYQAWLNKFNWEKIAKKYEWIYNKIVNT